MYKDEREIAKKAEQMLKSSLRNKTSRFASHVHEVDKTSLKDATAKAKVKKYGLVRNGTAKYYMQSISIKMVRHGFIQHYGVDIVRKGGERTRKIPRQTTYRFRHHVMNMKPTPFIDDAVDDSGVVSFTLENVAKHRNKEVLVNVINFLER